MLTVLIFKMAAIICHYSHMTLYHLLLTHIDKPPGVLFSIYIYYTASTLPTVSSMLAFMISLVSKTIFLQKYMLRLATCCLDPFILLMVTVFADIFWLKSRILPPNLNNN